MDSVGLAGRTTRDGRRSHARSTLPGRHLGRLRADL